ncbi:MAG: hypothetical protein JWO13_2453 [Acidobacteriales bacterium]|nr:hypothetical protein [Terriglobales bacterium]
MEPWFIATETFSPSDGKAWQNFIDWSGLSHLEEVVSLDVSLSPSILREIKPDYWAHIVKQDKLLRFFLDLDFLAERIPDPSKTNLLLVYRNPSLEPDLPAHLRQFVFLGYDLVELATGISALSNCGGFPDVFSGTELSSVGLIPSYTRAKQIQTKLRELRPEELHADCDLWAIFRANVNPTSSAVPR